MNGVPYCKGCKHNIPGSFTRRCFTCCFGSNYEKLGIFTRPDEINCSQVDEFTKWCKEEYNIFMNKLLGGVDMGLPRIKDVIFNKPATIVMWADGTKTVVKCGEDDIYDPEKGLAMAIVKKAYGNKGTYNNIFKKWLTKEVKESKMVKDRPYITVKEMAEAEGKTVEQIRADIKAGLINAEKVNGKWRIYN